MKQRSEQWFEVRRGRFTGSEIHKLMGVKGLGKTGESYALKKAQEIIFGIDQDESVITFAMQKGIDLEPLAFRKFKELKSLEFITVEGTDFFALGDNSGASPDGLVGKKGVLEIKCPGHDKFFGLVLGGESVIDANYIDQMQLEMHCTGSDKAYFFNYIIFNGVEMWHEIVINIDQDRVNLILTRIDQAVKIRDEYVKKLTENKQFN